MSKRIFLLDGHSLAHRAFYALPLLTNSDGEYTNAVFGFSRMLFKLIDKEEPDLITIAFDTKAQTFRHKEYAEYKATRKKMPEELSPQIPLIKELLKALKIPIFEIDGYEADDVIGTLAREGEKEGMEVNIVTGDRDALQLVTDNVNIMYTKKGITNIEKYDLETVREEYGLEPEQLVDKKGLMGDSSDNIPGVPGIGPKTSTKLLKQFSTMENVLDNIEEVSGKKRKENLRKYSEQARMSKRLGKIDVDVPIEIELEDCHLEEANQDKIVKLLKRLEFNSLLDRFEDQSETEINEVEIKKLNGEQEINKLVTEVKEQKNCALAFSLDDEGLVNASVEEIIIALSDEDIFSLPSEEMGLVARELLSKKKIEKYLFNPKEVMIKMKKEGLKFNNFKFEPLLAAYLLKPSNSLPSREDILKQELNIVLDDNLSEREIVGYITGSLFELKDILFTQLQKYELLKLYQEIEIPLIRSLAAMEFNGIKVDREYLNQLAEKWEERLSEIISKVHELAGEEFNLNSPQQLSKILFDKLGLPVIKKTKTGYSTSAEVLDELEDKHEIIPLIKEYRQLAKLKSTYVDALPPLINSETGRLHTSFNQMVTATGRLSSTEPNLQNIPIRTEEGREIRKAFVPCNEDWILLAADYSQVELRVLAHISEDENLISAFKAGEDIHTQTAAEVFDVKSKEVTSNMRREAKVINFGIAYGMSPYGLAQDLDISRKEAEDYIDRYFERFSGVKKYMDLIKKQAREEGYVTTIFNRRRYIPEIKSRNYHRRSFAERTAINTPIQGSAADIMKIAMINVYDRLEDDNYRAKLLLQVHDELVLEVSKTELERVAKLVKEEMEAVADLEVPLKADLQIGDNWRDKRDYRGDNFA